MFFWREIMKLSEISIQRPVLATVMSLVIIIFGVVAFTQLPVREYPDIDPPVVSVTTFYRGASPNVIETEITDILEEQLSTIEGVKTITSSSQEQGSVITITFELDRDVDDPIIQKIDVNAQPIMWLAVISDRHNNLELTDAAERLLKERILRLDGVGSIFMGGERRYAMRVWLDSQRMAARGLTPQDIENAIRSENAEIPAGRVS